MTAAANTSKMPPVSVEYNRVSRRRRDISSMSLRAFGNSLPVNQEIAPQSVAIRNDDVYLWIFAQERIQPRVRYG